MAWTLQFVDSIASSPTVRLDLNDGSPYGLLINGTSFGVPSLQLAQASTLLRDGSAYPAGAYQDRTLTLRLKLPESSRDNLATAMQELHRELNRPSNDPNGVSNILKWQQDSATAPVFFRTFPSPPDRWDDFPFTPTPYSEVTIPVLAEPFAYGLRETIATATVSNNPAAGSNGCFMDLGTIKGDVETPLIIKTSTTNLVSSNDNYSLFSMRRGGTPSNAPVVLQAEDMTAGTDTTEPGNDAAMSGSGSNYSRCSFGTTTAMATRLSLFWQGPGAAVSVDHRGTYRVFARIRRSVSGDSVKVQLKWGGTSGIITNDAVTCPSGTTISHIDLGLVSAPPGPDPVTDGLSGTELAVAGIFLDVQAQRVSGSGNIDFDYLFLAPADDGSTYVDWGTTSGANFYTVDCAQGVAYQTLTSGAVHGVNMAGVSGGFRLLASPGVSNRLYFIRQVRAGAPTDTIGGTNDLDVSYFPKYFYIRPATT